MSTVLNSIGSDEAFAQIKMIMRSFVISGALFLVKFYLTLVLMPFLILHHLTTL